jgi:hypothetical protein
MNTPSNDVLNNKIENMLEQNNKEHSDIKKMLNEFGKELKD